MSPLEIVGIITIVFVGGVILSALILLVPMTKLIKKLNSVSEKIDQKVVPRVEMLNKSAENLNHEILSLNATKERMMELLGEISQISKEAKKLKRSPLGNILGISMNILSMLKKGK